MESYTKHHHHHHPHHHYVMTASHMVSSPTSSGTSTTRRSTFGTIKILKYFLLSTLFLLLIGTLTLTARLFIETNQNSVTSNDKEVDRFKIRLLTNYISIFLITGIAIVATLKEHFFFLVTSASINLTLSFVSVFIFSIEWTVALLQIFTSLLTFTYLLCVYLKMKIEIQRRRKLDRIRQLKNHFLRHNLASNTKSSSIYSNSTNEEHPYDKITFTSKWILNQQKVLHSPSSLSDRSQ